MIVQIIGYSISIILMIVAVGCAGAVFLMGFEAIETRPILKSRKIHTKYAVLAMLSFSSAFFVFMTTLNGFSLNILFTAIFSAILGSLGITISAIINSDVSGYLNNRNITRESLIDIAKKHNKQNNSKENKS